MLRYIKSIWHHKATHSPFKGTLPTMVMSDGQLGMPMREPLDLGSLRTHPLDRKVDECYHSFVSLCFLTKDIM